jgi:hypothetical protein
VSILISEDLNLLEFRFMDMKLALAILMAIIQNPLCKTSQAALADLFEENGFSSRHEVIRMFAFVIRRLSIGEWQSSEIGVAERLLRDVPSTLGTSLSRDRRIVVFYTVLGVLEMIGDSGSAVIEAAAWANVKFYEITLELLSGQGKHRVVISEERLDQLKTEIPIALSRHVD